MKTRKRHLKKRARTLRRKRGGAKFGMPNNNNSNHSPRPSKQAKKAHSSSSSSSSSSSAVNRSATFEPNFYVCRVAPRADLDEKTPECLAQFVTDMGFHVIPTVDNGDCFYDSIRLFGYTFEPRLAVETSELRRRFADYMESHPNTYIDYVYNNESGISAPDKVRMEGVWDDQVGDLVPALIPDVLGLDVEIYNVLPDEDRHCIKVDKQTYRVKNRQGRGRIQTMLLLRVGDGHYMFIYYKGDAPAPGDVPAPAATAAAASSTTTSAKAAASNIKMKNAPSAFAAPPNNYMQAQMDAILADPSLTNQERDQMIQALFM